EAVAPLERSVQGQGRQSSHYLGILGVASARAGWRNDALRVLKELEARSASDLVTPFDLAHLYLAFGDTTRSLDWLERGVERKDSWLPTVKAWPWFESLESNPRYLDLVRRMNLPW
ncbi:MAG TPA: hypothetical protein VF885_26360, partial [Arthrobacter sp.]